MHDFLSLHQQVALLFQEFIGADLHYYDLQLQSIILEAVLLSEFLGYVIECLDHGPHHPHGSVKRQVIGLAPSDLNEKLKLLNHELEGHQEDIFHGRRNIVINQELADVVKQNLHLTRHLLVLRGYPEEAAEIYAPCASLQFLLFDLAEVHLKGVIDEFHALVKGELRKVSEDLRPGYLNLLIVNV